MLDIHLDKFLRLLVKDLNELFYLDEPNFKLLRILDNEFFRNSFKRYHFSKKEYKKRIMKENKDIETLIKLLPFNKLTYFKSKEEDKS